MNTHSIDTKYFLNITFIVGLLFIFLIFSIGACSSKRIKKDTPSFKIVKITLAKGINESGGEQVLVLPTSKYSYRDPAVFAHVKLANISGKHNIQWKWYNPEGELYNETKLHEFGPSQGYMVNEGSLWHKLSIKGEKASTQPGKWKVEIYFDGDLISYKHFEIVSDRYDVSYDVDSNIPKTNTLNPDAVAIVIGNRNYEHKDVPNVDYAHHDAEIMKKYLNRTLGYENGNIILIKDASKAKFEALFGIAGNYKGELYDFIRPNTSDVFVYYSGHGAPDLDSMKGFFIPVDCDPEKITLNGYSLELLYENLSRLEARSITVVMEACFSGGTNSGINLTKNASPALIRVDTGMVGTKNMAIFSSSSSSQISSWYNDKNHGLFTFFFMLAIGGAADKDYDNKITFQEIHDYVSDRSKGVPYWAKRLHGGRTQTPMMFGSRNNDVLVNQ